jgi:RNA polymerase sigma-B factor
MPEGALRSNETSDPQIPLGPGGFVEPERLEGRALVRRDELKLFEQFRVHGDMAAREKLVLQTQGIAIGLARRFKDRGVELDDLMQVAQIGLLHAIDRFDPTCGVPFIGFATPTILGELRRHFRSVWSVRMPRSLQENSQRIGPALSELQQELGRTPTIEEIGVRIGIAAERVLEAMEAGTAFRVRSLDAPVVSAAGTPMPMHSSVSDDSSLRAFEEIEARATVERLLPLLAPRSRKIVELRFFAERSQKEIAEIVGISQMHVSRLLRAALEEFSSIIANEAPEIGSSYGAKSQRVH